ncbi:MAG: HD domain-containing protein [Oscillospiraceae bacterium]|jgi:putative two-component system response regulator|nr:HD domain-containing protein [Oscillospiraceae bacterium]
MHERPLNDVQAEDILLRLLQNGYSVNLDHCEWEHAKRVAAYTKLLLRTTARRGLQKGLTQQDVSNIITAARFHDIGKALLLPEATLSQEAHTTLGAKKIVEALWETEIDIDLQSCIFTVVRSHHERWDGFGYPDGLKGEETPLAAQIVALANSYDCLRVHEYKSLANTHEDAVNKIIREKRYAFSPAKVELFLQSNEEIAQKFEQFSIRKLA